MAWASAQTESLTPPLNPRCWTEQTQQVGKKTLELLTQAGAMDDFGIAWPKLSELIPEIVKFSEAHHEAQRAGQRGLFDSEPEETQAAQDLSWQLTELDRRPGAPDPEWLKKEKALLGVYLSSHPLKFHREDKRAFGRCNTADLAKAVGRKIAMVAVLAASNERLTKNLQVLVPVPSGLSLDRS